ncbi:MAG TPA: hypothetical protein PLL92_16900, partial [Alicycliphilus sp.]|nr:hypothetical protein [Alicycliphilus sp.]
PMEPSETPRYPSSLPGVHRAFLDGALPVLAADERLLGVAAVGSFAEDRMDAHSDLDLVLCCEARDHAALLDGRQALAASLGRLVAAFTGEHVGEPRLLICLYGPPVLHVDLKFMCVDDLGARDDEPAPADAEPAPTPVAVAPAVAPAPAAPAPKPAPAPTPAVQAEAAPTTGMPRVQAFTLPVQSLMDVAQASGLQWVNSDADKVAAIQAAIAAEPKPVHVPRQRPPAVVLDEGPLVLVETRRDLRELQLPFEKEGAAV